MSQYKCQLPEIETVGKKPFRIQPIFREYIKTKFITNINNSTIHITLELVVDFIVSIDYEN